jgi:hypothetical protein
MTLQFLRNKVIEVEPQADGSLSVSWRLTDDLLKAEINLIVQPPDLEIIEAEARLERFPPLSCREASTLIKKVEGVSVGSGLRKIVAGVLGGSEGCSLLIDAVLEMANAVILHFTRPGIEAGEAVTDPDQKLANLRERLKANPRLVRSCISFQDDSPIMEGLNL